MTPDASANLNDTAPPVAAHPPARPRVLIVGGGFAGLNAAQALTKMPVDVTLIDRRNHHTFQPLLYQVALAVLSPADIAQPIRSIMANDPNVEVLMDEVVGFDVEGRRAFLRSGSEVVYDYMVLATGATHSYFRQRGVGAMGSGTEVDRGCDRDSQTRAAGLRAGRA